MTELEYLEFNKLRIEFYKLCSNFQKKYPSLKEEIQSFSENHLVKNAIVYNKKLDDVKIENKIKYIFVTDNPGVKEQEQERYAVGSSGSASKNFFHSENLIKNFDMEVIVLNKTMIHTRITSELKKIKNFDRLMEESQIYMARLLFYLQNLFSCKVFIFGTSNLRKSFKFFTKELKVLYKNEANLKKDLFLFYHFSQGQFKIRYNKEKLNFPNYHLKELLKSISDKNIDRFLGGDF